MRKIGLGLLILLSLACARHEAASPEDQYREIQSRIDRKEYSQAETELHTLLDRNPKDERARMILASLYVSQAEISLKDFFGLEKLSHLPEKPSQSVIDMKSLQKLKAPEDTEFGKAVAFVSQVNELASRYQEISQKFEQIPVVDATGAEKLYQALGEMEKIENPNPGNSLYRGVIKLYYFRYLLKNGNFLEFGNQKFCSLKVSTLADRLGVFETFVVGLLQDAARGFPKQTADFQKQIQQLDQNFHESKVWLDNQNDSSLTVKELTEKLAKAQSIQEFQCEF